MLEMKFGSAFSRLKRHRGDGMAKKQRKGLDLVGVEAPKPLHVVSGPKAGSGDDPEVLASLRRELEAVRAKASEVEQLRVEAERNEKLRKDAEKARKVLKENLAKAKSPRRSFGTNEHTHIRKRDGADVVEVKANVPREVRTWMKHLAMRDPQRWPSASAVWQEAAELMRAKYDG